MKQSHYTTLIALFVVVNLFSQSHTIYNEDFKDNYYEDYSIIMKGVNPYDANMMDEFSVNTFHRIMKASNTILSPSYVVRRCYFLVNGKKLAN